MYGCGRREASGGVDSNTRCRVVVVGMSTSPLRPGGGGLKEQRPKMPEPNNGGNTGGSWKEMAGRGMDGGSWSWRQRGENMATSCLLALIFMVTSVVGLSNVKPTRE